MKNTIERSIEIIRSAADKDVFSQICAVCSLQHEINNMKIEKKAINDTYILNALGEIQKITVFIEKNNNSSEANKYLLV